MNPDSLFAFADRQGLDLEVLGVAAAVLFGAAILALLAHVVLFAILRRAAPSTVEELLLEYVRNPARPVAVLLAWRALLPLLGDVDGMYGVVRHLVDLLLIGAVAWLLVGVVNASEVLVARANPIDVADNVHARTIRTQMRLVRRLLVAVIVLLGLGLALMTFPGVRQVGTSLLASAGVAGIAVGLAAQPVLTNLIAGIQLAVTSPIRLDDVVIVEGEWGRIEEIHSTFVIVKIWDERRLVVPLSRFIEQPFQNWTRSSSQLLGTVFLYVDYTVPVDEVRAELTRIVEASPHWDQRAVSLVVTDVTERSVQLRALVSAADASRAWDLRCEVREGLVRWLQREHPESLPRLRGSVDLVPPSEQTGRRTA